MQILIRDMEGGETKAVEFFRPEWPKGIIEHYWDAGRGACDCNRGNMFDGGDHECGDTRFAVKIPELPYEDNLWEENRAVF